MGVQPFLDWPRDIDHLKPTFFARELKLSPETAKNRVRRMEKDGLIQAFEIYPNLALLGLQRSSYMFQVSDVSAKNRGLRDLDAIEGVGSVENFLGPQVGLEIFHRTPAERERRVQLVCRFLGGATALAYVPQASLPVKEPLSRLDWRIIQALRHRANRPLPNVAKELGVSARTVRRRVDDMWEQGSFDTTVQLDVSKITNHLLCNFHIRFQAEHDPKAVQSFYRAFDSQWAYCWAPPDRNVANLVAGLVFNSPVEVEAALQRVLQIPGVASVEPYVTTSYVSHEGWLDDAIAMKIEETPKGDLVAH